MYRSPRLLALAKTVCCVHCGASGTTVPAHANWMAFGKGKGLKAHDWAVAFLCFGCHNLVDKRTGHLDRTEQETMWASAWASTVEVWFLWVSQPLADPKRAKLVRDAIEHIDADLFERWTGNPLPSLDIAA